VADARLARATKSRQADPAVPTAEDPTKDTTREDPTDSSFTAREDPTDPTNNRPRTDPSIGREDPTDPTNNHEDPTEQMTPREEPTAPAEPRTMQLQPPWLAGADPLVEDRRPRDPMFWPVVVFVAVLVGSIGIFLYNETRPRVGHSQTSGH
jgi:hypothetical protein